MALPQSSDLSLALWQSLSPVTNHLHYGTASVQWLITCTMAQPQSSDLSLALWQSCSPVTDHLHYGTATVHICHESLCLERQDYTTTRWHDTVHLLLSSDNHATSKQAQSLRTPCNT